MATALRRRVKLNIVATNPKCTRIELTSNADQDISLQALINLDREIDI
jgi:hypothetical protein